MCGIAGIVGQLDEPNRAALLRMSRAMAHRGPDGEGSWESTPDEAGRGVLLTHRRLAILDLSPAGAQPMIDEETGHVLVFNGEIYNYLELRDRLDGRGRPLASTGDSIVLLRALATRGADAVGWLRGMFAFACWDPARRRLLLARDPLGIKPLYLVRNRDRHAGWSVAFASELRALLASGLIATPRLDPRAVASVVWNGFVVGPSTAVEGVELLSPGSVIELDGGGEQVLSRESWGISPSAPEPPLGEEELACELEKDVRLHLASDVPLAVFLSGGIDSSAVANLAQRASGQPVHTFTLAFEAPELNEGPAARRIAEAIGSHHREVLLTERRFVANLEPAVDSLDQPTFDGLNSYYMSQAIREAGFTVALVGTGGDELFGGYSSFRDLPVFLRWSARFRWMPRRLQAAAAELVTAVLLRSGGALAPQTRWAKLPDMLRCGADLRALYQLAYALYLPGFQRELLAPDVAEALVEGLTPEIHRRLEAETRARSPLSALAVMEQRLFLGERLLRDNDAASMAASIEQRVPLVDRVLFEAVDRLPDDRRFLPVGRKEILRRVGLRGLPAELFERPKSGFVLPFDRWIRERLGKAMDGTMRDPSAARAVGLEPAAVERLWRAFREKAPGLYWSRVWAIYVLMRWCQRNRVLR
ncbi:MAG TPA: asparagine synthase (glutamine-hydrolyzing) [Anaeromyxobacter sp.]|nr:asparagine synthase (glutamine-hydrolyzing) [Anaeromyxobacter sp.]